MRRPTITFSFKPRSSSRLPMIAASVSTRVVSWNDAAEMNESVDNEALVMPSRIALPSAGRPPASDTRRFSERNLHLSTTSSGRNSVSPMSSILTQRIIWRVMVSRCLSSRHLTSIGSRPSFAGDDDRHHGESKVYRPRLGDCRNRYIIEQGTGSLWRKAAEGHCTLAPCGYEH